MRQRGRMLVWMGMAIAAVACGRADKQLTVSGRVEVDRIHIGSKIGGRVWKVFYDESDMVTSGSVVIELDRAELEADLAQAQAQTQQAQAQLDLLLAGTRAEDIRRGEAVVAAQKAELKLRHKGFRDEEVREAEAQLTSAQSTFDLAGKDLERAQNLRKTGVIDQQEFDNKQTAFDAAQAGLKVAQERLGLVRSGSRPEEIAMAEAALAQAQADLDRLHNGPRPEEIAAARAALAASRSSVDRIMTQLDETRILTPSEAMVETLDLKVGDLVKAGQTAAVMNLMRSPYVRCYVPEDRMGLVQPGMAVTVSVDAYPGELFPGVVRRMSSVAEFTPRNVQTAEKRSELVFEMKVDITGRGDLLRAGMYADVHIPRETSR